MSALEQVIGLCGPSPHTKVPDKPVSPFLPSLESVQSRRKYSFFCQTARRYVSSRANSAQMTRAFLFATATQVLVVPSLRCFSVIHRLRLSCLVGARYTTDLAPWINSMRKYGSPRLVIPKWRCLSPLEWRWASHCQLRWWRQLRMVLGTSPTHAANCRPLWKVRHPYSASSPLSEDRCCDLRTWLR